MGKRLVIACGGNALGNNAIEQLELVQETAKHIVDLVAEGYDVVVTHGNGPQVGVIKKATDFSAEHGGGTPPFPFPECGAMSQGYIGYQLQQAILRQVRTRDIMKGCATVITQTVVDADDPAFHNPTKPIGAFMSEEEAKKQEAETGFVFKEDAGRGWRRVVASPIPRRIVEYDVISAGLDAGYIMISTGGGGIPVIEDGKIYKGVDAVIDKDRGAALLARECDAEMLIILTAVDKVAINFNKPDQKEIDEMTVSEAREYMAQGQFAPGSMLPKVEACIDFVENNTHGGRALITSLEKAAAGLRGETGTIIKQD